MKKSLKINRYRIGGNLDPVWITYLSWKKVWIIIEEYRLKIGNDIIAVPKDFEFDLSSIPRPIWWLIAPFELSIVAPLIHDYLYRLKGRIPVPSELQLKSEKVKAEYITRYTREDADKIFLILMEREGVSKWKRAAAYRAVRLFGPRW